MRKFYPRRKPKYKYAKAYNKFFNFCSDNKVELLNDDEKFIIKIIERIANDEHEAKCLMYEYFKKYISGIDLEKSEIKKQNTGRRMANLYLLEFID